MPEKICLPLETKHGFVVDNNFIHSLKIIHEWCKKESSLSSIMLKSDVKADMLIDMPFNELICHVLEGLLPDNSLLFKATNEVKHNFGADVPQIQSQKPYDVCVVDDSPIYAEISDTSTLTELTIKGKHVSPRKCNTS